VAVDRAAAWGSGGLGGEDHVHRDPSPRLLPVLPQIPPLVWVCRRTRVGAGWGSGLPAHVLAEVGGLLRERGRGGREPVVATVLRPINMLARPSCVQLYSVELDQREERGSGGGGGSSLIHIWGLLLIP